MLVFNINCSNTTAVSTATIVRIWPPDDDQPDCGDREPRRPYPPSMPPATLALDER